MRTRSPLTAGPLARARPLAIAALVLALCVLGWRAAATFSAPPPQQFEASAAVDQRLTRLLEPVLGEGRVAVTVANDDANKDGRARSVIVLVDTAAAANIAGGTDTLQRLVIASADLNIEGGDRLTIEQLPFVTRPPGLPSLAEGLELAALALLAVLSGAIAILSAMKAPQHEPARDIQLISTGGPIVPDQRAEAPLSDPLPTPSMVADDPAKAVDVLRGWMAKDGGRA